MNIVLSHRRRFCRSLFALSALSGALLLPVGLQAQPVLPPSAFSTAPSSLPQASEPAQAAFLTSQALAIAYSNPAARPVAVRTAAAILPLLPADVNGDAAQGREALTDRWFVLLNSNDVPPRVKREALSAFFDVAARVDAEYAFKYALLVRGAASRAGALLDASRGFEKSDYGRAIELTRLAARAARSEEDLLDRSRALTFVAYRATTVAPELVPDAIREASSNIALIQTPATRDTLYAELVGAVARYDLALARDMAGRISDEGLKNLAAARINLSEVSQTTLTARSSERVQSLVTAAAPYDSRALPFLLQLPPQQSVLEAIAQTLPPVYVTARPAIETSQLERIWDYTQRVNVQDEATLRYRDQLQSRLARLMVLKDLWRGRAWGKQLAWKGGRVQVGAFLKEVLEYRQAQYRPDALQDVALRNEATAYRQALRLPTPAQRVESLLLLAGQLLEGDELPAPAPAPAPAPVPAPAPAPTA